MDSILQLTRTVCRKMDLYTGERLFTVAISGIDAAGKGYISDLLRQQLELSGHTVALINTDPWQHPMPVRFSKDDPAGNIYDHIICWKEFFEELILPLQRDKQIYQETKGIRADADLYYPLLYDHPAPDILLIEGIFHLKKEYLPIYDLRIWVDCSFETGLQRATSRNAEMISREQLIHDYHHYYYAARRLHFERDEPRLTADIIYDNETG